MRNFFRQKEMIRSDEINIRLLREEDLPALEWDGEYKRYRRIYREVFHNFQKGISYPLVAETAQDGVIGQVFLTRKEPNPKFTALHRYFFLSSFRVKAQYRGMGIGSRLLELCEKHVLQHHLRDIYLNCAVSNHRARWFYLDHGFHVIRIDNSEWSFVNDEGFIVTEPQHAYLMKKSVS